MNGEFVGSDGASANPESARKIVLSRALCQFESFPKRPGLEGRALVQAARLHASAHGPFAVSDYALYRQPEGIAIWYWDRTGVEAALYGRRPYRTADFVPEGAGPDHADGAVLIARHQGEEAQLWRSGTLLASLWRRRAFTAAQWRTFAGDEADAPRPPAQTVEALSLRPRGRVGAPQEWPAVERAAWLGAALGIAATAFFVGQWLSVTDAVRRADIAATASLSAIDPATQRDAALVKAYAEAAPGVRHLLAAADALDALDEIGLTPTRWSVTQTGVEAHFRDISADDLAAAAARLEEENRLANVRPQRNRGDRGAVVAADVRGGGA